MQNLAGAFRGYVAVENLNGDNRYSTPHHGPQAAKKAISFVSFPPVLFILLKRWTYDVDLDQMVKVR
jgi:ubiquitin carboxyl-terminal hydrolase 7